MTSTHLSPIKVVICEDSITNAEILTGGIDKIIQNHNIVQQFELENLTKQFGRDEFIINSEENGRAQNELFDLLLANDFNWTTSNKQCLVYGSTTTNRNGKEIFAAGNLKVLVSEKIPDSFSSSSSDLSTDEQLQQAWFTEKINDKIYAISEIMTDREESCVPLLLQHLCFYCTSATAAPLLLCCTSSTAVPLLLLHLCFYCTSATMLHLYYCCTSATAATLLLLHLCYAVPLLCCSKDAAVAEAQQ